MKQPGIWVVLTPFYERVCECENVVSRRVQNPVRLIYHKE